MNDMKELHAFEDGRLRLVMARHADRQSYLRGLLSLCEDLHCRAMFASARGDHDAMHALLAHHRNAYELIDAEFCAAALFDTTRSGHESPKSEQKNG